MFKPGDIVECFSFVAGYPKYHLCVLEAVGPAAAVFLYINSGTGYAGDFVVSDADIPCLPKSPTGQSVISCSQPVRINSKNLKLTRAKQLGTLDPKIARKLEAFVQTVQTLTPAEKKMVLVALALIV